MATLVQALPSATGSMLSGRPSSSGGYSSSQASHQAFRTPNMARYNNQAGPGYRGMPSSGPVAPYAFTSTPQLSHTGVRPQHPGHGQRSASTSMLPQYQQPPLTHTQAIAPVQRHQNSSAISVSHNNSLSLDFSKMPSLDLTLPTPVSNTSLNSPTPAKPSPDRYRRSVRRVDSGESGPNRVHQGSAPPSGSGMAAVGQLYNQPAQSSSSPSLSQYQSYRGSTYATPPQSSKTSSDDIIVGRSQNTDLAARYRRRSLGSIETAGLTHSNQGHDAASHPNTFVQNALQSTAQPQVQRPTSGHTHTVSSESVASSRSGPSSRPTSARNETASAHSAAQGPVHIAQVAKPEIRHPNTPTQSTHLGRRNPSPLSKPVNINGEQSEEPSTFRPSGPTHQHAASSAAVEHLSALNQKEVKKSKSKLRRAFSFGSAAELRKVTAQANLEKSSAAKTMKRSSKYEDELEPEQARIAEKQEAAGLGESIYSGQGNFFTGSTDNLSISSTASSASIMLRKMGKGLKKGTRSMVGLFRPKSVLGVPAADGPVNQGSAAQVSMVTVEAERENVNVNVDPHEQAGGGTGFPRLERNSIDTAKVSAESETVSSDNRSRRSIVGGERERAEILAAVKKGILKRNDSNQPSPQLQSRAPDFSLPQIPNINDSPHSSAPSTPADEPPRSGHRRTDSITIEGNETDDYFASVTRFASLDSKTGQPITPQTMMRNISFSPRLQFHDTWPSGEYDRRGDIATCNRLTPMLAQQIKEELNTFKMVCYTVHGFSS
jgi:hypothetical protein